MICRKEIATLAAAAIVLTLTALALLFHAGCTPSHVQAQATAADTIARGFNRARPIVEDEYRRAGERAIDGACDADGSCDRARLERALREHQARWRPVAERWEAARVAHDAWREELERCALADAAAAECASTTARLGARFASTVANARCALRSLGRADLDTFPGPEPDCPREEVRDAAAEVAR